MPAAALDAGSVAAVGAFGVAVVSALSAVIMMARPLHRRQLRVFSLAVRVFLDYKHTQYVAKRIPKSATDRVDSLWEATHERNAAAIHAAIVQLEGLWVKAGQYLSTRSDVLPEPYLARLKLLQDAMPPRPLQEIYSTIEEDLGQKVQDLFDSFSPQPLATASIAQVHRAVSVEGREVVVKVQHVGIKDLILQDLSNLRSIVSWVAWADPAFDMTPLVEEWAKEVPNELNFQIEAENMRVVANNLRIPLNPAEEAGEASGGGNRASSASAPASAPRGRAVQSPSVEAVLPQVIRASRRVLVMSYADGVRLNDEAALDELQVDRQQLVNAITRAYAHQIFVDGFFNADPHPGNFLVSRSPPHLPVLLDFGLTKRLPHHTQLALAKMLLAAAEGDLSMLLSSFSEMGLKLRYDVPQDAMSVTSFFFRRTAPPKEAREENMQYIRSMKERQEQQKEEGQEKSMRRNPIDAFPSDIIFFIRVLNLLRGLSSLLGVRVSYLDIMKPFAEHVLSSDRLIAAPSLASSWICPSPILSPLDQKIRTLLHSLGQEGNVLGAQVCVYKDGKPIADVAAGFRGRYDPLPVCHDTLFPSFSVTKGVAAALVHWIVDRGLLNFSTRVSEVWREFEVNGKETCTVADVLRHRAGLENALTDDLRSDPLLMCNWPEMLKRLAAASPSSPPGVKEAYHYLTFGWLVGGIVEGATGRPFQQLLQEVFVEPLGVKGEFYIGIPPGVEARLATLSLPQSQPAVNSSAPSSSAAAHASSQTNQTSIHSASSASAEPATAAAGAIPTYSPSLITQQRAAAQQRALHETASASASASSSTPSSNAAAAAPPPAPDAAPAAPDAAPAAAAAAAAAPSALSVPLLFNSLFLRRAIIPSANGHFSARALARFYAALAEGGVVPAMPQTSDPPLGSERPEEGREKGGGSAKQQGEEGKRAKGLWPGSWWSRAAEEERGGKTEEAAAGGGLKVGYRSSAAGDSAGGRGGSEVEALLQERGEGDEEEQTEAGWATRDDEQQQQQQPAAGGRRCLFTNPNILDAFVGEGEFDFDFESESQQEGKKSNFGLGFVRIPTASSSTPVPGLSTEGIESTEQRSKSRPFGHPGLGGSVAFCDPSNGLAVAILLNQLSSDWVVTKAITKLICSELEIPTPTIFDMGSGPMSNDS